jgi:transposase
MDTLYERAAGLDVHKDTVVACVRTVVGREVGEELAEFGTTTPELLALRDWLAVQHPQVIGMESTGVYWKPVVRHEAPGIEWR